MRIILCGFGVVGQSLVKLFDSRSEDLYAKYGLKPRVVGVFDSKGSAIDSSGLDLEKLVETKRKFGTVKNYAETKNNMSGLDIIKNLEAEVLIETTASNYKDAEPGMTHITSAMKKGMHVISVNKGPLALAFPSLLELATYNQVMLKFSGTVGGGTPILDYAKDSLRGEKNAKQYGITVLLKGSTDVISDGKKTFLYTKKIPAMTVGGTGDVLSGLTAGMLAKNRNPLESAAAATFINGLAGMAVQKKLGLHMTSMDLLDEIANVMKPFDKIV